MIQVQHLDLVKQIFDYCDKYNLKICTAESCTGGLLASYFTYLPGSSEYFDKGIVSYSNEAKMDLLNIPKEILGNYGAVSSEVATLMAKNISLNKNKYISISTTGLLGPKDDGTGKPVGLIYIAVNIRNELLKVKELKLQGDRHMMQEQVIVQALELAINSLKLC